MNFYAHYVLRLNLLPTYPMLKNSILFIALALSTVLPLTGQTTIADSSSGLMYATTTEPFFNTENANWPYGIMLTWTTDGELSQGEQKLAINITDLPAGAQYRVVKSTANTYVEDHPQQGNFYIGPAVDLVAGLNTITVGSVAFDRQVRIQFSSGAIGYDGLVVNPTFPTKTIGVDDFAELNTGDDNNLAVSVSENGFNLTLGPGTSSLGRDAYGVGTSTFGLNWALFDASYAKFGNSGNQQQLDLRITNNTGSDAKLKNISFDLRRDPANANYATDFQLLYLATGDSELVKGPSIALGSEMNNLVGLGSDTISVGINNFSEPIGQNISGTAWIADGGYANIRLKLNTTAPVAATQLDNLVFSLVVVDMTPPVITLNGPATIYHPSGYQNWYTDPGATATDNSGESITAVKAEYSDFVDPEFNDVYYVTWTATDSSGNESSVTRTVITYVPDVTPPVITLNGSASLTLTVGDVFTDLGVTVFDNSGESIAAVVSGDTVDPSVPGVYVIVYNASDSEGNAATPVSRTVTVEIADADGDGVADSVDVHPGYDDAALSAYLSNKGYTQGGLTQQDLLDARVGSTAVSVSGGTATISLQVEQSADNMQTWSSPTEGATTVDIPVTGDASFFRVRAQ